MKNIEFSYKLINYLKSEATIPKSKQEMDRTIVEIKNKLDQGLEVLVLMDKKPKLIRKTNGVIEIINIKQKFDYKTFLTFLYILLVISVSIGLLYDIKLK